MRARTREEDIEKACVELCQSLGWSSANVYHETYGEKGSLGREDRSRAVLEKRLRAALKRLNPTATSAAIDQTVEELTRDRSASSRVQANRDIHKHLIDGFRPTSAAAHPGEEEHPRIKIIDWKNEENNDFFLAQQFWIQGPTYERRADLVGFVNGLPLVFIELKNIGKRIEDAYQNNLRDYLENIPQLFWTNAFIILSNGLKSLIGTITSSFEHFKEWKRVEREDEVPRETDAQIYKTFVGCDVVQAPGAGKKTEKDQGVQAKNGKHLKKLLEEDHRYVFTLIQKFRTEVKGAKYDKISDRSDIIVMADEAHRSQYDTFALNLRNALPNAAFIGFTGTPLLAREEKTMQVFGDYVSVYNFRQAMEDNATVPLWYEARIPPLQLTNDDLAEDLEELLEEAELDDEQQKKVEREFARQYHLSGVTDFF